MLTTRTRHVLYCVIIVLLTGVGSRVFHTGFPLFDKYLGDALYAVLGYLLLSLFWKRGSPPVKAALTMIVMVAIESFQLTGIPLAFRQSPNGALRLLSILLGTTFSWLDLLAYLLGIVTCCLLEHLILRRSLLSDSGF